MGTKRAIKQGKKCQKSAHAHDRPIGAANDHHMTPTRAGAQVAHFDPCFSLRKAYKDREVTCSVRRAAK